MASLSERIAAPGSEISVLRADLRRARQQADEKRRAAAEARAGARALMQEALEHVPYHAQADLRRRWETRWPWLKE